MRLGSERPTFLERAKERLSCVPGCLMFCGIWSIGLLYLGVLGLAGFAGIEHHLGYWWALAAFVLAVFRFPFPLVVGAYFGAVDVWGWHWFPGVFLAAPGLALAGFLLPGFALANMITEWLSRPRKKAKGTAHSPGTTRTAALKPLDPALVGLEREMAYLEEQERHAERYGAWLREQGIDPDTVAKTDDEYEALIAGKSDDEIEALDYRDRELHDRFDEAEEEGWQPTKQVGEPRQAGPPIEPAVAPVRPEPANTAQQSSERHWPKYVPLFEKLSEDDWERVAKAAKAMFERRKAMEAEDSSPPNQKPEAT